MGIHEDAREGNLVGDKLNAYVERDPSLLNELDPKEGLTPLAAATIKGHVEEVEQLLKKCARADVTSKNGETPLLLATRSTILNRSRIVQLLLRKTPPCFVDATCWDAKNNTPLMFAIKQRDLESIRLLRDAAACLTLTNNDDFTTKDLAKQTGDNAIECALYPDKEHSDLFILAKSVLNLLVFMITWVNEVTGAICQICKLDPQMNQVTEKLMTNPICEPNRCSSQINFNPSYDTRDDYVCTGGCSSPKDVFEELRREVESFGKNTGLERFYKDKEYIKKVTRKVGSLKKNKSTSLTSENFIDKTLKVSLHRQVIYCDDSSSMRARLNGESQNTLWDCQKELVKHITGITTLVLPEGEGVVLRFINEDVKNSLNLTTAEIGNKLAGMEPVPTNESHTKIGTSLKSKILKPLVYDKLKAGGLERPLLISIITDGRPTGEDRMELVNTIVECGKELVEAGYHREDVKFVISQIGAANAAAEFLDTIRDNSEIRSVVYCTTDRLDERFAVLRENKDDLDQWLMDTLYEPIKNVEQ